MLRTLAAKAIVPVAFSVACFVAVCLILLYSALKEDRIEENIRHANDIAGVLVKSTRFAMLKADRETLRNIVSNVSGERIVDHVRIFNKQGVIVFSGVTSEVGREVDKEAEGCSACHASPKPAESLGPMEQARRFVKDDGEPVLAITAAIYNEPECYAGECHYHPPARRVLGTLDIGLSEEPLQATLAVMRRRLALYGVLVLVLSVGGVAALLRVNVVGPLRRLLDYVNAVAAGRPTAQPAFGDEDLSAVARAFADLQGREGGAGGSPERPGGQAPGGRTER